MHFLEKACAYLLCDRVIVNPQSCPVLSLPALLRPSSLCASIELLPSGDGSASAVASQTSATTLDILSFGGVVDGNSNTVVGEGVRKRKRPHDSTANIEPCSISIMQSHPPPNRRECLEHLFVISQKFFALIPQFDKDTSVLRPALNRQYVHLAVRATVGVRFTH